MGARFEAVGGGAREPLGQALRPAGVAQREQLQHERRQQRRGAELAGFLDLIERGLSLARGPQSAPDQPAVVGLARGMPAGVTGQRDRVVVAGTSLRVAALRELESRPRGLSHAARHHRGGIDLAGRHAFTLLTHEHRPQQRRGLARLAVLAAREGLDQRRGLGLRGVPRSRPHGTRQFSMVRRAGEALQRDRAACQADEAAPCSDAAGPCLRAQTA